MTHSQLIARLEQLTGADREVDAAISAHFGEATTVTFGHSILGPKSIVTRSVPRYTASVDAALALAEKVLPNTWNDILREALSAMSLAHYWHIEHVKPGQLTELPRQICIAILKAHGASK